MTIKYFIKNAFMGMALSAAMVSCTDVWDNHYTVNPNIGSNTSETLWEIIERDSSLTEFKEFLVQTGYADKLKEEHVYTVWAPVNGTFNYTYTDKAQLQKEFVENHIADFNHVASGETKDDVLIKMLNGKYLSFIGTGDNYTLESIAIVPESKNIPAKNGVLHKLQGSVDFVPSIWEMLAKIDSASVINDYLKSFTDTLLDQQSSVVGPIVNGQITYLDSVVYEYNPWFYEIGKIAQEDSSYTMIVPTNKAWNEKVEEAMQYFVYSEQVPHYDSIQKTNAKRMILRNLVFSNSINKHPEDSLISTTNLAWNNERVFREYPDGEVSALLKDKLETYNLSNGTIHLVDQLNYSAYKCWYDTIKLEGESSLYIKEEPENWRFNLNYLSVNKDDSAYNKLSGNMWGEYAPLTTTGNPKFTFTVPGTLSAAYRIKAVLVPQNLVFEGDTTDMMPNRFDAKLKYWPKGEKKAKTVAIGKDITNDPTRIDTVSLVNNLDNEYVEFRYSEYGLELEETTVELEISGNVKSKEKEFSRTLRIDCIILEPVTK